MERRPTPYQEDWDDIMKKLRSSVLSSRREMNFDPSYIRPKWYCTRQGVLASYKKKGHWEPQHRMRNPPKDIKKAKSNRDDMIEAAGVESYKLIYGRDRSDNKSPPPAVRDDTSVVYSDSAGGFSDTGDKYTSDDDTNVDNVVLKLLTAANVESCKTLLESLVESPPSQNTTTASVLSDETRYFSSSEGNATSELTATSARSNGDASSDTYQLLLDTFQANIRQQVANMGHTQSRLNFTEDDENTSGTPSEGTAMKPNIPRQGEKKLNAPSEESEKSFKGSIQSPDQDRQVEDLNMSAVSSMLLNAFCRATHDALRELHSNPDVSPKASEELLEAALTIATDEELFATLFTSVSRLPWSSTTPDSSLTGDTTGSRRTQTHEHLQRQVNPELAYGTSTSADESSEILDGSFLAEDKKEQKRAFASDSQTHAQNRRSSMQQTRKTKTCTNNSARTSRSDGSTTGTHESDDSSTGTPSDGDVIRSGRKVNHAARARRRQILYNSLECPVQIHNPRGRPSGSGPRLNLTVHRQESEDSASDTSSYSDVLNSDGLGDTDGAERKPDHSHSTLRSDGRRNGVGEFYEHTAARKQLLTLQCRSNRDKRCLPVKQHDVFSEM
ncbi:hypothetical protein BaRGS_00009658 [Batillaria attramentaria]|uniref:Uncharacterized protein n=1 Tax=Batillaria attramentaria TaxID=370345 RepID=A0ABD0LIV1_9CAEN